MKRIAKKRLLIIPVMGLVLSSIFLWENRISISDGGRTYINISDSVPDGACIFQLFTESTSFPAEEGGDDDDDPTREHHKWMPHFLAGALLDKHFFDHPAFDQTHLQVATPPPRA